MKVSTWIVAGLILGFSLPVAASSLQDDVVAVGKAVADFHFALEQGNRQNALSLLDPEIVVYETGYVEAGIDAYGGGHLDGDIQFAELVQYQPENTQVRVDGDLAYVLSSGRSDGTIQGQPVALLNTETMVLKRGEDGWRIVHIHWSAHEPQAVAKP